MEYVDFNNDYCVDYTYGKLPDDDDKLREVYIDGYPDEYEVDADNEEEALELAREIALDECSFEIIECDDK